MNEITNDQMISIKLCSLNVHCETTAGEIFRKEERVVDGIS